MPKHNAENERVKHRYFVYLKEARRQSEATVDAAASALDRFEIWGKYREFEAFHFEQAVSFKRHLAEQTGLKSGEKLSKATLYANLAHLKRFFEWLSQQPGFKSRIRFYDAEYFNLSDKEVRIATAQREQIAPTLEQIKHVIGMMPNGTEIERRDRTLIAFTLLTGARDGAIASMKMKHVDLVEGCIYQDAREVNTKFSKTFHTYFFPVGDDIRGILATWVSYLREEKVWGNDDPLFPATHIAQGPTRQFQALGLERVHWRTASPIRKIFGEAFKNAGLRYFNPHSFRKTLVGIGLNRCQTAEQFKVWSQNLGHEQVLTTFVNYGEVSSQRQGDIMRDFGRTQVPTKEDLQGVVEAFAKVLRASGAGMPVK